MSEVQVAIEPADSERPSVVPDHLAIIPDGNRRWAREQGIEIAQGHIQGFQNAKRLLRLCRRIGIHTVTLWGFSTENWRRGQDQVTTLMALFEQWIAELVPEALEEGVRFIHLGRLHGVPREVRAEAAEAGFPDGLPQSLRDLISEAEARTAHNTRNIINVALNYGGVDEVERAISKMQEVARSRDVALASLDLFDFLDTRGQPYPSPDLILRTSGEHRLSGLLPMQSAYAELVFVESHFPGLTERALLNVVEDFGNRERRFGGDATT